MGEPLSGVWHFSFTVSSVDDAVAFYTQQFGFELVHTQEQKDEYTARLVGYQGAWLKIAQLRVPGSAPGVSGHDLELVEYVAPPGRPGSREIKDPGAAHLAVGVDDIHAWHAKLSAAGVRFVSEPNHIDAGVNRGGWAVYFFGPDDIVHELVEPPEGSAS